MIAYTVPIRFTGLQRASMHVHVMAKSKKLAVSQAFQYVRDLDPILLEHIYIPFDDIVGG